MLKIAIVGGGPAGLFFAKLMKIQNPANDIEIFEQNSADNTYGFGVVFTDKGLKFLEESDPELMSDIIANSEFQNAITIHHRKTAVSVKGNVFYGIARVILLNILQKHCLRLGIKINFEVRIDSIDCLKNYDVIVGADGINSFIRESLDEHFNAKKQYRINKWVWYATTKKFENINLIFHETDVGMFIAHNYRFTPELGGCVIECDPETWQRSGLDKMSDEDSRLYCSQIFGDYLEGRTLISNRSLWFNPSFVTATNWYWKNIVLIGDALKTVHPTTGSGTRVGMQDALALAAAFKSKGNKLCEVFPEYRRMRKPGSDEFQSAALRSIVWYEDVKSKMHLDPFNFAFSFMMRTGKVNYDRLRSMDPAFVTAYETAPSAFLQS